MRVAKPENLREIVNLVQLTRMGSKDHQPLPDFIRKKVNYEFLEMIDVKSAIKIENFMALENYEENLFIQNCINFFTKNLFIYSEEESLF